MARDLGEVFVIHIVGEKPWHCRHDHECNSIPDRPRFVKDFDEVEASLRALLPDDKGSGCAIS